MRNSDVTPTTGTAFPAARLVESNDGDALWLGSHVKRGQHIEFTADVLSRENPMLAELLAGRPALVVVSPSVHRLYGSLVRDFCTRASGRSRISYLVLRRTEATKTLDAATEVSERASAASLHRTSPIVAIGGGVCSDICGVAAAMHRRGVPHINVPTTLIGLVDAGIGLKCAVNHSGRKSALGAFHPPEHTVLDRGFLPTLPVRHLVGGLAEIVKLAVVRDPVLFELLERDVEALAHSGFLVPAAAAEQVVRRTVTGMLEELARNPFETVDYRRRVDFGHTFSPHIETASGHSVIHGEAVAHDIALSTQIATELGILAPDDGDRILDLLGRSGLALAWREARAERLWASLSSVVEHRDGALRLVVPTSIGDCTYLDLHDIGSPLIAQCLDRLR